MSKNNGTRTVSLATFLVASVVLLGTTLLPAGAVAPAAAQSQRGLIEPQAGTWRTWVLTSGSQFRLPPPPNQTATAAEIGELKALAAQRDGAARDRVQFWDTGAPGYRWNEILRDEIVSHGSVNSSATTARHFSLLNVAIYDATIAAWDSKYAYNRSRPSEVDSTLASLLPTPASPSYPSEHAAVAAAASGVLAYLFPDDAAAINARADEAVQSRLMAGIQYPSDTAAGRELGQRVAELVIERARHDGSEVPWAGSVPSEPGLWSRAGYPEGTQPLAPAFGTLKPWVLESGNQFRPGPPPAFDSAQRAAEVAELKALPRTFPNMANAFFWQSSRSNWDLVTDLKLFEYGFDRNPPRAARAAALVNIAAFDAVVACWDAKFTYWAMRPVQVDPDVRPLFQTPAHPSYPAAHGCYSGSQGAMLAHLFPADAASLNARADEAGMARMWAGIHYRSDVDAGLTLGRSVAQSVIDRARADGSQ